MDSNILTLILLAVAVVIGLKLRSVLGRRTEDDEARVDRTKAEQRARAASQDKVVTLPRRQPQPAEQPPPAGPAVATEGREQKIRSLASGDPGLADSLIEISNVDRSFDPDAFLNGAKAAYEMIVVAFAEGNRKTLKPLLSREVYDGFHAAISERESRNEIIEQSFVGINKAEIVEAELKKGTAQVTVRFVSDLITATRDKTGTVLAGDPNKIKEVIDIWTFAREVSSRDPNWKLVATQAPG